MNFKTIPRLSNILQKPTNITKRIGKFSFTKGLMSKTSYLLSLRCVLLQKSFFQKKNF